ncbi:MAG: DUF2157 domain-containing protein [Vicinamibacterales bacterium]
MKDRARALADVVTLARQHGFSAGEIAEALRDGVASTTDERRRGVLVRVLGFIGGTFVFAGVGVFIALQWDSMNSAARVVITLGSGLAAFVLGVMSSRDPRFDKATAPMFLMAAALEPTGMLVAFNELGSSGDWRWASLVTCGSVALQFGFVFGSIRRSTLLFLCVLFGTLFFWTAFDMLDVDDGVGVLVLGGSLLLTAVGVDRTPHRVITPVWYLFGAAGVLYGVFDNVQSTPFELVFLFAAAGFVYLSVALHSRTLLFVATVGILAYTGWFTGEYFADSVGWPIALIIFGLLLIGLSALALRIDRDYVRVPGV